MDGGFAFLCNVMIVVLEDDIIQFKLELVTELGHCCYHSFIHWIIDSSTWFGDVALGDIYTLESGELAKRLYLWCLKLDLYGSHLSPPKKTDKPPEEEEEEEEVSEWKEGDDLVVERRRCGPGEDVDVEVLYGAACAHKSGKKGKGGGVDHPQREVKKLHKRAKEAEKGVKKTVRDG